MAAPKQDSNGICIQCRASGEVVVFDDRLPGGFALTFCQCIHGRALAAVQIDTITDHCT